MKRRRLALAAAAVPLVAGCSLFPSDPTNDSIRTSVAAVTAPSGWTQVGAVEPACAVINLDCQDRSVRTVFRTDGDGAAACADLVTYLGAIPTFAGAAGLVGAAPQPPSASACTDELSAYQRYLVLVDGPSGSATEQWRLRLTPADGGYQLSVVLGDPPLDPWE